ncbi:hypothetical protein LINPERHAP1_LOCUS29500, partial [Linum perenne]
LHSHTASPLLYLEPRRCRRSAPPCSSDQDSRSSSLKLHLQKSHKKLSSGSVDSAVP